MQAKLGAVLSGFRTAPINMYFISIINPVPSDIMELQEFLRNRINKSVQAINIVIIAIIVYFKQKYIQTNSQKTNSQKIKIIIQ